MTAGAACIRFVAHADVVPLLGVLRTSAVIGALSRWEDPTQKSGPTEIIVPTAPREERRHPDDRDAFHRHRHEGIVREGMAPSGLRSDLSLTPPTLFPQRGRCFVWALQGHGAVTRGSVMLERADAFVARWNRAWD